MWGILALGGAAVVTVGWAAALVFHDEKRRRLPDRLTLPAAAGAFLAAALTEPALMLGGLGWAGLYLAGGLAGRGIGGGDVKLALSLGVVAAAAGGAPGVFAAVAAAGAVTAGRGLTGRGEMVPHGPSMLVGASLVVFCAACQGALASPGNAS